MGFVWKRFYETYAAAPEKLRQLVAEIPWGHNILIMQRIKDEKARQSLFFPLKIAAFGISNVEY